ncbi:MAG: hypothetical protein Q3M24_02865 [Candidatus Electrothrix aestuarii]|uniref:Uncharacterized protein n=1 Tax=Candidatus Electrothrix aestuarii TaxID=3062594 RepID=A0AAU8LWX1_9BACT|nr:hypothetical protein [Candidatus Electrothrix aestuarii]
MQAFFHFLMVTSLVNQVKLLHQVREEVHRLIPDAKVNPLDREIITKLKDGLYDIELENDEVVSSIIRSRQEWSSPAYNALSFKKAVEKEGEAPDLPIYVQLADFLLL